MTHDELKQALFNRRPVVHAVSGTETEYDHVSAIIYRLNKNQKLVVSAELSDKCGHSVSIVGPERVRYKEGVVETTYSKKVLAKADEFKAQFENNIKK